MEREAGEAPWGGIGGNSKRKRRNEQGRRRRCRSLNATHTCSIYSAPSILGQAGQRTTYRHVRVEGERRVSYGRPVEEPNGVLFSSLSS